MKKNKNYHVKLTGSDVRVQSRMRLVNCVPSRAFRSTTLVPEVDIIMYAYPVDKPKFSNPLYPEDSDREVRESRPIQATDGDTSLENPFIVTPTQHSLSYSFSSNNYSYMSRQATPHRNSPPAGRDISSNLCPPSASFSTTSNQQQIPGARDSHTFSSGAIVDSSAYIPRPSRYPDYVREVTRKASFQTPLWSVNGKPNIDMLAMYGFFFTGRVDLVRCFQCGIGLKDWVQDDDVLAEHIKHATDCVFLYEKFGKSEIQRLKNAVTTQGTGVENSTPQSYRIRTPRYQTMDSRIASFSTFPAHLLLDKRTMAVAGLYYTGTGDLCRCFACDGGLKDWATGDDPIKEHATYFSECPYMIQLKGSDYVARMKATRRENGASLNERPSHTDLHEGRLNLRPQEHQRQNTSSCNGSYRDTCPDESSPSEISSSQGTSNPTTPPDDGHASLARYMENLQIEGSIALSNQVFQQLGYSDADVMHARTELEKQGNTNPTSDAIINAILDRQERQSVETKTRANDHSQNDLQAMLEENERLLELVQCMLCVTGEPDILFLPCAHHKVCRRCAESLTHCPVCEREIKEKIKTYRS